MITLILFVMAALLIVAGLVCSPILIFVGLDVLVIVAVVKGIIGLFKKKKKSK